MLQKSIKHNAEIGAAENPLFWQATAFDTLWTAWERVQSNAGAAGGDGVGVERFAFFARASLHSLSNRLRQETYRPGDARRVYVPKPKGGYRPLDIPCVIDRVAQGAVALTLGPILDAMMEPSSFAYRPGRGVADAVARVSSLRRDGFTHVVDADIKRYFENVPHEKLLLKLQQAIGDDSILDLIALWLEWYGPHGLGLPQGSPLSPLLANLYLDLLDESFVGRGLRIVRYADDFLLLCRSENIAENALPKLSRFLAEHGLELNAEKTRIVPFEQGFRFLGHLFVRSMVLKEVGDDTPSEDAIAEAERLTREMEAAADASSSVVPMEKPLGGPMGEHAPAQRTLYVIEPKRIVTTQGESFRVEGSANETLLLLPPSRLNRIEVGPAARLDDTALDLAAAHDIDIVRVNGSGETVGIWSTPDMIAARARRHLAQAACILDPMMRLDLARKLVEGRIRGQRALLHRLNRDRKDASTVAAAVFLRRILRSLTRAENIADVMGYEGAAAAQVWPSLNRALLVPLGGQRRHRRPAATPLDLILNGLSSLLSRDIRIAILRAGLHPGFAVLHQSEDGEDALVYDLMEEFRTPLVEATALALVNRKSVTAGMFDVVNGVARMDRNGWAALIRGYEAAAARVVSSPQRRGNKVSWRQLMSDQAQHLAQHFEGTAIYESVEIPY